MRQLGARLPETPPGETSPPVETTPPVQTDVETPGEVAPQEIAKDPTPAATKETSPEMRSEISPDTRQEVQPHEVHRVESYPVEVHRIERQPAERNGRQSVDQTAESSNTRQTVEQPAVSNGRQPLEQPVASNRRQPIERPGTSNGAGVGRESVRIYEDPQRAAPVSNGRWAEFNEFRHSEPGRGRRLSLERAPREQELSWNFGELEEEAERRSSFLTLAVPGIAALLAVGALLWSGTLRNRLHQQDAAMTSLQQQNRKLAEIVAEMSVEQNASSAPSSAADSTSAPDTSQKPESAPDTSQNPQSAPAPAPQQSPVPSQPAAAAAAPSGATPSGAASSQAAGEVGGTPVATERVPQSQNRQGVSTPPLGAQTSAAGRGSRNQRPVNVGHTTELVPPYPTKFSAENVVPDAASSQPVHSAGSYRPPFPVTGAGRAAATSAPPTSTPATSAASAPAHVPQASNPPAAPASGASASGMRASGRPAAQPPAATARGDHGATAATPYSATEDGQYASLLAENIEEVQGLQRHSPAPLREFHLRAGIETRVTPGVRLSVRNVDASRGSYALQVSQSGENYQLRGGVNSPLSFADNSTHREYALVILRIADQQVFGYLRSKN